jgi:hypothetical protein
MKTILTILFMAVLAFGAVPAFAGEAIPQTANASKQLTQPEIDRIVNRVKEIQKMDKKSLSSEQKHELRNELMVMKKRLSDPPGVVVYLSGTAIVILIIILILLLV